MVRAFENWSGIHSQFNTGHKFSSFIQNSLKNIQVSDGHLKTRHFRCCFGYILNAIKKGIDESVFKYVFKVCFNEIH